LPKHLAVIEADGFYHHKLPKVKVSDARKNAYLLTRGYKVLRLQGDDRNRLPLSAENQILEFVKMPGTHVQLPLIG
jgi:very-short-patch-repair endonuclease